MDRRSFVIAASGITTTSLAGCIGGRGKSEQEVSDSESSSSPTFYQDIHLDEDTLVVEVSEEMDVNAKDRYTKADTLTLLKNEQVIHTTDTVIEKTVYRFPVPDEGAYKLVAEGEHTSGENGMDYGSSSVEVALIADLLISDTVTVDGVRSVQFKER